MSDFTDMTLHRHGPHCKDCAAVRLKAFEEARREVAAVVALARVTDYGRVIVALPVANVAAAFDRLVAAEQARGAKGGT